MTGPRRVISSDFYSVYSSAGKPPTGPDLDRFMPWNANAGDLRTWAQPPPARLT